MRTEVSEMLTIILCTTFVAKLDIEDRYRPNAAFMIIPIGDKQASGLRNPTYTLCALHGKGGGIYTGAKCKSQ